MPLGKGSLERAAKTADAGAEVKTAEKAAPVKVAAKAAPKPAGKTAPKKAAAKPAKKAAVRSSVVTSSGNDKVESHLICDIPTYLL